MTGFSLMLLGFPVIDGLHLLPSSLTAFPGLNGSSVPLGIFFVYGGVVFSMLTAVIYSVKAEWPLNRPSRIQRTRTSTFSTPKSKTDSLGYDYVQFILCGMSALS